MDNHFACVGGLDACFGRWDTHNQYVTFTEAAFVTNTGISSPLADVHPTDFSRTLFAGQDYNNGRVLDFQQVDNFVSNQLNIMEIARMPWHDVHTMIAGEVVLDLVQHFVERWNKIKKEKYKDDTCVYSVVYHWSGASYSNAGPMIGSRSLITFRNSRMRLFLVRVVDRVGMPMLTIHEDHPYRQAWDEMGRRFSNTWHQVETAQDTGPTLNALTPFEPPKGVLPDSFQDHHPRFHGTCDIQVVRSASNWSHGVLTEHSIQNAYIQLINEANHFIYIGTRRDRRLLFR